MVTFLIILGILVAGAGVYYYFYKTGKINDRDGDYIPDEVEDAVEDVKEKATAVKSEVKRRAKRVKEELGDVKDAIKEVGKQTKDVVNATKGTKRKGRKPSSGNSKAGSPKGYGAKKSSGSGKGRGRKYRTKKGPLLVVAEKCSTLNAAKNIPGVNIMTVKELRITDLAPGTSPGRVTVWTESAVKSMEEWK